VPRSPFDFSEKAPAKPQEFSVRAQHHCGISTVKRIESSQPMRSRGRAYASSTADSAKTPRECRGEGEIRFIKLQNEPNFLFPAFKL